MQYQNISLDAYLLAAFQHKAFALPFPPELLRVSLYNHQPVHHQLFWTELELLQLLLFLASFQLRCHSQLAFSPKIDIQSAHDGTESILSPGLQLE